MRTPQHEAAKHKHGTRLGNMHVQHSTVYRHARNASSRPQLVSMSPQHPRRQRQAQLQNQESDQRANTAGCYTESAVCHLTEMGDDGPQTQPNPFFLTSNVTNHVSRNREQAHSP